MSSHAVEQILVVPTPLFHELGLFQGFSREADRYLERLLQEDVLSFRPRPEMERDPSFKQLIPYVLFEYLPPSGEPMLFHYVRGKGQGESRLHAKGSIGVGGHISSEDAAGEDPRGPYFRGMHREIEEEVDLDTKYEENCLGLINDDSSEVGSVHLGIAHCFRLAEPKVTPREADLLDAGFLPVSELFARIDRLETWSQFCLRALYGEREGSRSA
ncbi:MAG TPA: phosphoesterase [Pirellulaceae bacterium]|jgi:predicted NUDIX family phosphoesterase|nr:phosphoesterase [Pirellulaceae bacterium]